MNSVEKMLSMGADLIMFVGGAVISIALLARIVEYIEGYFALIV